MDVRQEDKTLGAFTITAPEMPGNIVKIKSVSVIKNHEAEVKPVNITLKKNMHLLISGPNGIGKSTFLQDLATGNSERVEISPDARVGYYRQDFSTLDFDRTGFQALSDVMEGGTDEDVFRTAGRFLITAELLRNNVSSFSEGQKGLLLFARLVLQKPNLLILDEPTNHINFRHIPVIAKALDEYTGAMILVSHVPDFVAQIRIDEVLDLGSI